MKFLLAIIIVLVVGVASPKLTLHDIPSLTTEDISCYKSTATFFDKPLENLAIFYLGRVVISGKEGDKLRLTAYTIFDIPEGYFEIECSDGYYNSIRKVQ